MDNGGDLSSARVVRSHSRDQEKTESDDQWSPHILAFGDVEAHKYTSCETGRCEHEGPKTDEERVCREAQCENLWRDVGGNTTEIAPTLHEECEGCDCKIAR